MNRALSRLLTAALLAIAALALATPTAALAQPGLSYVVPGAVAPGKTTELTLHGTKLAAPLHVWTSFPAQVEIVPADPKAKDLTNAKCKLTVGSAVPIGIGGIAVTNAAGASDVVFLMLDDLPSVADNEANHAAATPLGLSLPTAVDGQSDGTLADYYRFSAAAGERISGEVLATRLGWDFDPLVRVLDSKGNELLLADDDPAAGPDSRFVFVAPASGQYLLELRDNRFKSGGRYRLRLGDFPLASTTLPLVAQRGAPTEVHFRGLLADTVAATSIVPLGSDSGWNAIGLTAQLPGRRSSSWASVGISSRPVFVAPQATKSSPEAAPITIPCVVSGALETTGQRDLFPFQAQKGTALRFRAITRSVGSPAILALRVLDSAGKKLAESPVSDSDEPVLSFASPADGAYQLSVEELVGRGGGDFTYAVDCQRGPQFSLLLKNDKNNRLRYPLASGGAFYLDVQCQRAGYDGPITLSIDSSRSGWQLTSSTIPAKANEVRMYVQPPLDLAAGELADLRIVGRAEAGGQPIVATMNTTLQLRTARPQMPYAPVWLDGTIFVSSTGVKPNFFVVTNRQSEVKLAREAGTAQLTLDLERTDAKFKDVPLTVLPIGLPAGVTAEVKRNGNGPKETYDITLKGAKDLPVGEHTFRYFAYAELGTQGRGVTSGDIRLSIAAAEPPAAEAKPEAK